MKKLTSFLKCISDETRFSILKLLLNNKLCVCQLTAILDKSQSSISQHLARFKELNLLLEERDKKWTYYSINREEYDKYLGLLVGLSGQSFNNIGLGKLEENLQKVKETDICDIRDKMS